MDLNQLEKHSDNKYLYGVLFLIYIVAGKHITEKPAENIKKMVTENPLGKYVVVFSAAFIATKSIRRALILSTVYFVVFDLLLEPESRLSLISAPKKTTDMVPEQLRLIPENSNDIINHVTQKMQTQQESFDPMPYN